MFMNVFVEPELTPHDFTILKHTKAVQFHWLTLGLAISQFKMNIKNSMDLVLKP